MTYAKRLYNSKGFNNYRRAIGTAAAVAAQRSFTRTKTKQKRTMSGQGITAQYDRKRVYTKKSMPKYKKRRWRKFIQKVNAVDEKDLGSQTSLFNQQIEVSTITAGVQLTATCALYSSTSTSSHLNDLDQISGVFNYGNPTAAADDYVNGTTKIIFKSGVLDITVRNTSDNGTSTPVDCPLEVDVYEITVNHGQDDNASSYNTLDDYFTQSATDTLQIGGTAAGAAGQLTISRRGATPWDLPAALSQYRMKIWKKTKYFLGVGQTFTYQMRDPRRHVYSLNTLFRAQEVNMNGLTKFVYFIAKPVPGTNPGATFRPKLTIGTTRKYLAKVEGMRTDRDYYFA